MLIFLRAATSAITIMVSAHAIAEPTSEAVNISYLRPYVGGNIVFVYTNTSLCSQAAYSIELGTNGGKAAYAAALTALAASKLVKLEIAGQCGAGAAGSTNVQSLYILQQ